MYQFIKTTALLLIISTTGFGQTIDKKFFKDADAFFKKHVIDGRVNYGALQTTGDLIPLIIKVEKAELTGSNEATKKAFYINAYNLHVIDLALKNYPLKSVQEIPGFFTKKKIIVGGQKLSLNKFEKEYMLNPYDDARLHFVLVCGALGCPPITDFAYTPNQIEKQLEQQTKLALNDPTFVRSIGNKTEISQIFKWYKDDFGGGKDQTIQFINSYRSLPINEKTSYYSYDWALNDISLKNSDISGNINNTSTGNNASRYVVSSTIPVGSYEIKIFNNLYSQKTGNDGELTDRSSFFTTTLTALYGLNNRLNIGINTRWRKVRNHTLPSSAFGVFGSDENGNSRSGLTGFGPMLRWAPIPSWENFSIQSSYTFAIGDELRGNNTQPFIDWNGAVWNTQFFNDFSIGDNFSLFTELDFLWEDIGSDDTEQGVFFNNKTTTPITVILSYNPNKKTTLYMLTGYAPSWSFENELGESGLTISDYFYQGGLGGKYQFTPNLEIELLYSDFTTKFLSDSKGQASTYNLGLRFNL